jgi:hypothetical protein
LTAKIAGTVGDAITTTETCSNASFGGATLGSGADPSVDTAITQLLAAVTANSSVVTGASDLDADTLTLTAVTAGTGANSIATTETCGNASFGAATLENGTDGTVDAAITALVSAITTNSSVVTAVGDTDADTVALTAVTGGTTGNSIATTETCGNAAFGGATLSGGGATMTADNAGIALAATIVANASEVVTATEADGVVTVTHDTVGTEQNSIATTETCSNGAWGAATLSGGLYATPCKAPNAMIEISGTKYYTETPVDKWSTTGWYTVGLS